MAYTQGETIDLTKTSTGLLLFSSAADSSYDPNPDAMIANITKRVTIKNVTISAGGSLCNTYASATVSGATVHSGGYLGGGNSKTFFSNVVVSSGGTFFRTGTGSYEVNLTACSGALVSGWNTGGIYIGGTWNVESGAIFQYSSGTAVYDYTNIYSDENNAVHNFVIWGAVHLLSGLSFADPTINATVLYLHSGTALSGGTNSIRGKGALVIWSGGTARDLNFNSGASVCICNSGATIGGSMMNAAATTFVYNNGVTYNAGDKDKNLKIENGVVTGLKLYESSRVVNESTTYRWLHDITLIDGIQANNPIISSGGTLNLGAGAIVSGAQVYASGTVNVLAGALVSGATVTGGEVLVSDGATVRDLTATAGTVGANWGATITDAQISGEAKLDDSYAEDTQGATIAGANTNIVSGGLLFHGADTGATVENGVVTGLGANGEYYRVTFGAGITIDSAKLNGNGRLYTYGDAKVYDLTIIGEGAVASVVAYDDSEYYDTVLTRVDAGAQLNLRGNNKAYNTLVGSGTLIRVDATATATDTTIMAGGSMEILTETAVVAGTLTLGYNGSANQNIKITNIYRIPEETTVRMTGADQVGTYGIVSAGGTLDKIVCANGLYNDVITRGGASYTNGIVDLTYSFDGTVLTAADAGIAAVGAAAKLADGATTINNGDKAAKWDATTTYTANVFLADGLTDGNAWLAIDGFNAAANLYGAAKDQDFTGTVNIGALAGSVKNLAAGAALGGSVAGVKLTVGDGMSVTGAVYAGGMGDVTNETETLVEGGEFAGNVFAGALCNYAAKATATSAGNIDLTVDGGTFKSNIYAGAAVKAGAATGVVHTAGDITVELNDGTAAKGAFCVYGGGYATGTTVQAGVYTAGDVDITINGGAWGTYASGRGIFGGVYADKVAASVESVDITVTGGTMGNIYGGGWAQNGGKSTVADGVSITIAGDAQVANVFGGGSYSSISGGATSVVGGVNITVAGGSIEGNIFAAGQNEFSTVTGDVNVLFTGANDYGCNVYGYGVQSSATSGGDKNLVFADYTGSLSGAIGGFDGIAFAGDTAAALSGSSIDNDDWTFDFTDRTLDAAALTLDSGTFAGDDLTLKLAASAAPADWSIAAGLADTAIGFDYAVYVGDAKQTFADGKVASGDYAGWGFAIEESVLKFKQLA